MITETPTRAETHGPARNQGPQTSPRADAATRPASRMAGRTPIWRSAPAVRRTAQKHCYHRRSTHAEPTTCQGPVTPAACRLHAPHGRRDPGQEAWAIGLGLAVGFSPFIGLHLGMCIAFGWLFGLNRLKLYLAANLVNPLIMPGVLFVEVQLGSWLRRGTPTRCPWTRSRRWTRGTSGSTCCSAAWS